MPRGRPVRQQELQQESQPNQEISTYKSYVSCFDIRMSWTNECSVYEYQTMLDGIAKRWVFQIEKGEQTGYIHLQGRISLIKKKNNKFSVLKLFTDKYKPNYIEPTINEEFTKYEASGDAFYQMKSDTRIEGPYTNESKKPYIPEVYNIPYDKLYPYQQHIYNAKYIQSRWRKVVLIYCPVGCSGKSTIATICRLTQNGIQLPYTEDPIQIMQTVHNIVVSKGYVHNVKIFVDLPRACSKSVMKQYILAIENMKGGYLYDMRNKYKDVQIDPPLIYVFCNRLPDLSLLSQDRWDLYMINDNKQLIEYNLSTGLMTQEKGKISINYDDYIDDGDDEKDIISPKLNNNSNNSDIFQLTL